MNRENSSLGFGAALIANADAMDRYLRLPKHKQEEVVNGSWYIQSAEEMRAYVERITNL